MIAFSLKQSGQVNRMTYPDLVPITAGFTVFFIMVSIDEVFLRQTEQHQNNLNFFSILYIIIYRDSVSGKQPCMTGLAKDRLDVPGSFWRYYTLEFREYKGLQESGEG
jgi:hypothetical protein